jgi:hypothetical protein
MKKKGFWGISISQYIVLGILAFICLLILSIGGVFVLNDSGNQYQTKKLPTATLELPTSVMNDHIVGSWLDTWVGTCTITIKRINGSYQMTRLYSDGSGETKFLIVQIVDGIERLIEYPDSPAGDYMVILENGNLAFYDNAGFIYEDYRAPLVETSTQVNQALREIEPTTTLTLTPTYVSTPIDSTTTQEVIFKDDFQDSGTAAVNWSSLGGTWVVETGMLSCTANGKYLAMIRVPEDFTFQLDIMGINVIDKIIVFRAIDDSTHYGIDFRTDPYNDVVLVKSLPGNTGQIIQTAPFENYNNTWYAMKVDVASNHIKAFINDQPIIDFIDVSSSITGGTVGVGAMLQPGLSVVYYDNIIVSTH